MQWKKLSVWLSLFVSMSVVSAKAATPTVTNVSQSASSVGKYTKFEATFTISKTFATDSLLPYYYYDATDTAAKDPNRKSPYGADGITIDGVFTAPSGKTMTVPAFYYQEYTRSGSTSSKPVMTPQSIFVWKLRFAPDETGTWTYAIRIQDKEGTTSYSNGTQFSVTNSAAKGFIRVSNRDSRFWQFDNGESFVPISVGRQWWDQATRSYTYETLFGQYSQNNINFIRIWDQNDGYNLTVENRYDAYAWPDDFVPSDATVATLAKGTQMNQRSNWEEDRIIESAEKNGVYIQLCSHADVYWTWDAAIYGDGWNLSPVNTTDYRHVNYWKRNFRYRVARWGYSTSILGWEHWNELGHIPANSEWDTFYKQYSAFQRSTDPYRHALTTSQGSQTWSPYFWSSSSVDYANYHDYIMASRYPSLYQDEVKWTYQLAQCLRSTTGNANGCSFGIGDGTSWSGAARPIVWGELDTGTNTWNEANPSLVADHNIMWTGVFSPIGMVPLDWYYQAKAGYLSAQYAYKKILGNFVKDIDYAGQNFTYFSSDDVKVTTTSLNTNNNTVRVLGMRSADKAKFYLWFHNKNYTWTGSSSPGAQSASVTVPGLLDGTYKIEYWNTETGAVTTGSATSSGGSLTLSVSGVSKSLAVKVISGSIPATATPSKSPTPSPTSGVSILSVLRGWGTTQPAFDRNGDGLVNLVDFATATK